MSKIQTALLGAMRDIAKIGIAKLGVADTGGAKYKFRGIDAAMNEMSPILVNNGVTVTPKYSELTVQERAKEGQAGKFTRFVTVKGSFTFAAEDGSNVVAEAYGEAMDSGDKATIKAQSVAFRTVLFQQFVVPLMAMDTELDGEDEGTDEVLDGFRAAAMEGTKALQAHFESAKPSAAFWARNSVSLKEAAMAADKAR